MAVRKIAKSNDFCASLADNILQKIDPIYRLNKQYEGSGFVESTEIMVDAAIGSAASGSAAPRTWSDSSGSFKVEANYLGVSEDKVFLRKMDGQEVSVPLSRLSVQDQRFVAKAMEESKQLGNPFEK